MAPGSWTGAAAVASHNQVWWECPRRRNSRPPARPARSPPATTQPAPASLQRAGTVLLPGKPLQKPLDNKHPNVPAASRPRTASQQWDRQKGRQTVGLTSVSQPATSAE